MKKEQTTQYQIEQIKEYLQSHNDEIFSIKELRKVFNFQMIQIRDSVKFRLVFDKEWTCYNKKERMYYFGTPGTIQDFIKDIPDLVTI